MAKIALSSKKQLLIGFYIINFILAQKGQKLSWSIPEHPRASWPTPNLDVLAQLLTNLWQEEFYEVKTNFSLVFLHKIYFAINQSKFELHHPILGWVIVSSGSIKYLTLTKIYVIFKNLFYDWNLRNAITHLHDQLGFGSLQFWDP